MKFVCDNTSIKLIVRHSLLDLTNGAKSLLLGRKQFMQLFYTKWK